MHFRLHRNVIWIFLLILIIVSWQWAKVPSYVLYQVSRNKERYPSSYLKWFRRRYNAYVRICLGGEKGWRICHRRLKCRVKGFGPSLTTFFYFANKDLMSIVAWDVWPMVAIEQLICVVFKANNVSEKLEMAERARLRDTVKGKSPYLGD